jgi:DNA sulfur modification protein DndC
MDNAADDASDLVQKLATIRAELKDEYLQPHDKPWIIGFSGGKDSTLVLQLVFDMLLDLPPSRRQRVVHVLSNDTQVESPVVQAFVDKVLNELGHAADALNVPVVVRKTTPSIDGTFWVNLIGRGYPAPNRLFRWCTDRMKIRPTTTYIREQASTAGLVILLLGVRRQESSARAKVVLRYDNGTRLNPHNDIKGCLIFRPIVELSTNEVWMTLLQSRPPWGGTHRPLATLYRNAQGGECPFVTDSEDTPSCGTSSSRFGCWTCTVVEKDKSMQGFIDNGHEHLEPLADFRDWLQEYSRNPANRMTERRNGQEGMGPFTMLARQTILDRVLAAQAEVELPLISDAEIERIKEIWRDDESLLAIQKANRVLSMIKKA